MAEYSGEKWRSGKNRKRLVIFLLFIIVILIPVYSDEYSGQLILERTSFRVDEEFVLTILIPDIPPLLLKIEEPVLPSGISILKGPYIRPGRIGSVADYYFKVGKEGRFVIGSFVLQGHETLQYTVPVFITAGDTFQLFRNFDKIPPTVKWEMADTEYYPGQIIPLQFTVENMEISDILIESTVLKKPDGIVRRISRNSEKYEKHITVKKIMTGEIYDITFHNHIFVPLNYGDIMLPDIEIFLSKEDASHSTVLSGIPVYIKKVSGPAVKTGAVGSFNYSFDISRDQISSSSFIIIKQKVWGTGNFYGLEIPAPYVDKPELIELTAIRDRMEALPAGKSFTGYRDISYRLNLKCDSENPECSGVISIHFPDFKWLVENSEDFPEQFKYQTGPGGTFEIKIVPEEKMEKSFQFTLTDDTGADTVFIIQIVAGLIIISLIPVVFFLGKNKIKRSVIIAVSLILLFSALIIFKIGFIDKPVYGVVFSGSDSGAETVSILSIPDIDGKIVAEIAPGQRVRIKNSIDDYYLISVSDSEDGWIRMENIRIDD